MPQPTAVTVRATLPTKCRTQRTLILDEGKSDFEAMGGMQARVL